MPHDFWRKIESISHAKSPQVFSLGLLHRKKKTTTFLGAFSLSWSLSLSNGGVKVNDLSECIEQMDGNNNSFWHFPNDFFDSHFYSNEIFDTFVDDDDGLKKK